MTRRMLIPLSLRPILAGLALLALAFSTLIPAGAMFSAGPSGPQIVICSGHGPLVLKDDGTPLDSGKSHSLCAFALHAPPALTALAEPVPMPAQAFCAPPQISRIASQTRLSLAAPPPPAIGPPAQV